MSEKQNVQRMLAGPGPLLKRDGTLAEVGWARQPVLDCNLENAAFYRLRFLQGLRIKRWDYYGLTTPTHFYSFTLSDLGYLQMVFAYVVDFANQRHHEETLTLPPGAGVRLPRGSQEGESCYNSRKARLKFLAEPGARRLEIDWPGFDGKGLHCEALLALPAEHESLTLVVPIKGKRFYYNRKINCMPVDGKVEYQGQTAALTPATCLGNLDWGRGVWEYRSFWVWTTASGFLKDGRRIGLNLGYGFGDTSAATENAIILNGKIHKLGQVTYIYDTKNLSAPWSMRSVDGRLTLRFDPFYDRVAKTDFKILGSEVHQLFGRFSGTVQTDEGETIDIHGLVGTSEEHHAKW
jgi:hypothetical protein